MHVLGFETAVGDWFKSYVYNQRFFINVENEYNECTTQKIKFPINDFFSKYDQILSFLRSWSHILKKSLMENFFFVQ